MSGFDCLGAEELGFDYGMLFKTAGGLLEGGSTILKAKQVEQESAASAQTKLDASTKADRDAVNAILKADLSSQAHAKTADADTKAAVDATAASDKAGGELDPDGMQKRADAAQQMLKNVQKAPKNPQQAALVKAWKAMLDHIQGSSPAGDDKSSDEEPFLTRAVLGPVPGYVIVAGGVGIAALVVYFLKKRGG